MEDFRALTTEKERKALQTIGITASVQLAMMPTSIETDLALLEQGDAISLPAVRYRLERKLCLVALIALMNDVLFLL